MVCFTNFRNAISLFERCLGAEADEKGRKEKKGRGKKKK